MTAFDGQSLFRKGYNMITEKAKDLLFTAFLASDITTRNNYEREGIRLDVASGAEAILVVTRKNTGEYVSTVSLIPMKIKTVSPLPEYNEVELSAGDDVYYHYIMSFSDASFIDGKNANAVYDATTTAFGKELYAERKRLDKIAYANGTKTAPTWFREGDRTPEKEILLGFVIIDTGNNEFLEAAICKEHNYEKIGEGLYKVRVFYELYDAIVRGLEAVMTAVLN